MSVSLGQKKALEYVADRYTEGSFTLPPSGVVIVCEDYRAGFVQGLEAALEAIVHADSDGLASAEIRRMLGEEA